MSPLIRTLLSDLFGPSDSRSLYALRNDLHRLHLRTQALRAIRLFVVYLATNATFPNGFTWKAAAALAAVGVETVFQQMAPQLPLSRLMTLVYQSAPLSRLLGNLHDPAPTIGSRPPTPTPGPSRYTDLMTMTSHPVNADPATDPAQDPQAVPKTGGATSTGPAV